MYVSFDRIPVVLVRVLPSVLLVFLWVLTSPARAAEKTATAWWEAETAMKSGGELPLVDKTWWPKAQALKPGEQFELQSEFPEGGRMIVRRENVARRGGNQTDSIVWILDDDGDMKPGDEGDLDSDCYVVDYGRDGKVDRIVDYQDTNGDGRADSMDIRYFYDGSLRRSWFGIDLDGDGRMWDLAGYEYSGNFFASDPYGDAFIYMNEYDPELDRWTPSCECPFAFYDLDGDESSEAVVRIAAAPIELDPRSDEDMDYGNTVFNYQGPFTPRMRRPAVANVRYSRDLDDLSSDERPLHYDFGFNMTGRTPYDMEGIERTDPLRRHPKTTRVIPHEKLIEFAETFEADATGFSQREFADAGVTLGAGDRPDLDRRWEGIFWTWNRRFMHNSGGPIQFWNIRHEYSPKSSTKRVLYYSRVDRRIHLQGATDGWIRVGRFIDKEPYGEIRMFDTDRDGRFDRWEYYRAGRAEPVRTATPRDLGIRELPGDWDALTKLYREELLPEAIEANETMLAALNEFAKAAAGDFTPAPQLEAALEGADCPSERLYILELLREERHAHVIARLREQVEAEMDQVPVADLRFRPKEMTASEVAWTEARLLADFETAYSEGRYDSAAKILGQWQDCF